MNRHSFHWGATASGALIGFYVAVVGASAVGMVACRARHLVDLVPLLGAAGVAGFLFDWDAVLTIEGLDEPATARWALPEGT